MDSFDEFLDYMLYQRRCSEQTVTAYRNDLRLFSAFLDSEGLGDPLAATTRVVRRWMLSLLDGGMAPRSVNRKVASLRSYFRYFCSVGKLKINPCRAVESVKTPKKLPVFLHEDEMALMLDEKFFPDTFEGRRDRAVLQFFYLTGVRRAELIDLTVGQVDLSLGRVVVNGKRNKQRIIPLTPTLKSILISYLHVRQSEFGEAQPSDRLFVTAKGAPLYPMLVYNIAHAHIAQVTTATKMSPHVLRHTFATILLNNGADLMAIKELLGHSSLAATQIYAHSDFEQLNKIYKLAHPRAEN